MYITVVKKLTAKQQAAHIKKLQANAAAVVDTLMESSQLLHTTDYSNEVERLLYVTIHVMLATHTALGHHSAAHSATARKAADAIRKIANCY